MNILDIDSFLAHYITAALWSSMDGSDEQGGDPLDANYGPADIAPETLEEMRGDCAEFIEANEAILTDSGLSVEQAGHDFWLTRCGHGAGFWDRGLGAIGKQLSEASKVYGSVELYVGDDGQIYA